MNYTQIDRGVINRQDMAGSYGRLGIEPNTGLNPFFEQMFQISGNDCEILCSQMNRYMNERVDRYKQEITVIQIDR